MFSFVTASVLSQTAHTKNAYIVKICSNLHNQVACVLYKTVCLSDYSRIYTRRSKFEETLDRNGRRYGYSSSSVLHALVRDNGDLGATTNLVRDSAQ